MARQIIIKVVGDYCNLRCDYCFYSGLDQSKKTIMDISTLSLFMQQFLTNQASKHIQFIWHGGEPLLAGLDFFEEALNIQRSYPDYKISNALQTNGSLINDSWISFFKENDFGIGISFDGSKSSHDAHRLNTAGKGTFDSLIENIKLCNSRGLKTGLIQTITKDNINNLEADWEYIYSNLGQDRWGVNIYNCNSTISNLQSLGVNNIDLNNIYERLINFWMSKDDEELSIGEIDDLLSGVLGKRPKGCTFNGTCGSSYFCLNYDGNVYLCDRTSNVPSNAWGNINVNNLNDILSGSKKAAEINKIKNLPIDCKECKWVMFCNNGCAALRDAENKYIYCDARKASFEYLTSTVNNAMVS